MLSGESVQLGGPVMASLMGRGAYVDANVLLGRQSVSVKKIERAPSTVIWSIAGLFR